MYNLGRKKLFLMAMVFLMSMGCKTKQDMKDAQKRAILNYVNAYNEFDVQGMTKDLAAHVVFQNVSNGNVDLRTVGIVEFEKQAEAAKQYFKERKQIIESWEFLDAKVIIGIDYKAVLAIDLPNGFKKGDSLVLKGVSEFEFENGKITGITDKS